MEDVFFLPTKRSIISSNNNQSSDPAFMYTHIINIQEGWKVQIKAFSSNIFPDTLSPSFTVVVKQTRMKQLKKNQKKKKPKKNLLQVNCQYWLKSTSGKRPDTSHIDIFAGDLNYSYVFQSLLCRLGDILSNRLNSTFSGVLPVEGAENYVSAMFLSASVLYIDFSKATVFSLLHD